MKPNDPHSDDKGLILNAFGDFLENDSIDGLFAFFQHIGFDPTALPKGSDLSAAILGFYAKPGGGYDIDRAALHLATYGPIASRIVELQSQKFSNDLGRNETAVSTGHTDRYPQAGP